MPGRISLKVGVGIRRVSEYIQVFGFVRGLSKAVEHLIMSRGFVSRKPFRTTTPDGDEVWLRPLSSDLATYREVFVNGEYDLRKFKIFGMISRRYEYLVSTGIRPLIVDAGANIGLASVFLSRLFPRARFVLIEPSDENIEVARLNVSGIDGAELLNKALWHEKIALDLVPSRNFSTYSVASRKDSGHTTSGVESITMNEILDSRGTELFIVKADIEGSEAAVFQSNNDWLNLAPIIMVEPHDQEITKNGSLRGLFERRCYQTADVIMNGTTMIFVPQWGTDGKTAASS